MTNEFIDEGMIESDKIVCDCGNDEFRIYITTIVDDVRAFCTKCKERVIQ